MHSAWTRAFEVCTSTSPTMSVTRIGPLLECARTAARRPERQTRPFAEVTATRVPRGTRSSRSALPRNKKRPGTFTSTTSSPALSRVLTLISSARATASSAFSPRAARVIFSATSARSSPITWVRPFSLSTERPFFGAGSIIVSSSSARSRHGMPCSSERRKPPRRDAWLPGPSWSSRSRLTRRPL